MNTNEELALGTQKCTSLPTEAPSVSPIFILGIFPRSGTNYLHDLLRMHPACESGSSVLEEDNFIFNAHSLLNFIEGVSRMWKQKWGAEQLNKEKEALCSKLGEGLISFLSYQLESRKHLAENGGPWKAKRLVVTKTPSVNNLTLFFRLFPASSLLILVRDGRSVVESSVKTFDHPYDYVTRQWALAARSIQKLHQPTKRYLIVRYEDLYGNVDLELRRIFEFLHLDPDAYDYRSAVDLPVRGSSILRGVSSSQKSSAWVAQGIHWEPTQKPQNFNPIDRWRDWGRARHERFNWLAGKYLVAFGYAPKKYSGNRLLWAASNSALDLLHLDTATWFLQRINRQMTKIRSPKDFYEMVRTLKFFILKVLVSRLLTTGNNS